MIADLTHEGVARPVPRATYRLQLNENFRLSQARDLVPYLHDLGVSHIYASPLCKARPHSAHGYDICDFNKLNPELGTEADLADLVGALRSRGMGLILDIVPNHMEIGGPDNAWWWDVLARGPESPFTACFDIDWNPPDPRTKGKVLVPALDAPYDQVLEKRGIRVEPQGETCVLRHGQLSFPLKAGSLEEAGAGPEELNSDAEALDELIQQQFYRLTWSGHANAELNYRRFFNVSNLAGTRVEDGRVFLRVLGLTSRLLERGWVDGLRVDHPDGLRDPEQFLRRLDAMAPGAWIVVEKILERDEELPESWPVAGTTGYDFLDHAGGLFIDPGGERPLTDFYHEFTGNTPDFPSLARDKRRLVLKTLLAAESDRLAGLLVRVADGRWQHRDFTRSDLCEALAEFVACFPVYRTYARPETERVAETDARHIARAADEARRNRTDLRPELFDLLAGLMLLKHRGGLEAEFAARFQQLTAPAMAKGVEDTAFYCFNRLSALNEVGGDPGRFGCGVEEFHEFCRRQQKNHPASMLATSTHDTKRSEDVRARLSLLSEIPSLWIEAVLRWSAMNERHRTDGFPDRNWEYLYYQTLVGAWPISSARAQACMRKMACEAREHTNWEAGNNTYESALSAFIRATLADAGFLLDLERFVEPLLKPGCVNSLAQTFLKLAAPGVPDIYQGTELWDLSLVDPDNRRPVDFQTRQRLMAQAKGISAQEAWNEWGSGLPKLWLIQRVLKLRARRPDLFGLSAGYEALMARGAAEANVVAFKRSNGLIIVVPRLQTGLSDGWGDTTIDLPSGIWRNELTGDSLPQEAVSVAGLLRELRQKFCYPRAVGWEGEKGSLRQKGCYPGEHG